MNPDERDQEKSIDNKPKFVYNLEHTLTMHGRGPYEGFLYDVNLNFSLKGKELSLLIDKVKSLSLHLELQLHLVVELELEIDLYCV